MYTAKYHMQWLDPHKVLSIRWETEGEQKVNNNEQIGKFNNWMNVINANSASQVTSTCLRLNMMRRQENLPAPSRSPLCWHLSSTRAETSCQQQREGDSLQSQQTEADNAARQKELVKKPR